MKYATLILPLLNSRESYQIVFIVENKCDEVYNSISISEQQASRVEENTRQQSNSKVWFEQRSGRVTASKLHSILHTELSNPSVSLIKLICYPQNIKFSSDACSCGCKHKDEAKSIYCDIINEGKPLLIYFESFWFAIGSFQVLLWELLLMALYSAVAVGVGYLK